MTVTHNEPCKKCHTNERYKSGACKYCSIANAKKWYKENKERAIKNSREWKRENRERAKENNKKSREKYIERTGHDYIYTHISGKYKSEYFRERYKKNGQKLREAARKFYHEHREEISKRRRENRNCEREAEYREKNKEKVAQANREWAKNNKDKVNAIAHKKRAILRNCEGSYTSEEWIALCEAYGNKCLCCRKPNIKLTVDHIIPLSRGGSNYITNIQPLCQACNNKKYTKTTDYRMK